MEYIIVDSRDGIVDAGTGDLHDAVAELTVRPNVQTTAYWWLGDDPSRVAVLYYDIAGKLELTRHTAADVRWELVEHGVNLLVDGHHGIYSWQVLADQYPLPNWGIDPEDVEILKVGPEHEHHWDAVESVMGEMICTDKGYYWIDTSDNGDIIAINTLTPSWALEDL